ncbi:taurine catabolism dioxygenase tauD, tfdA family domain-containing protein [Ditylenchus destructor]|nr:taurine catabolism dioxygenase tauD, tfdA family domain-containing protein [Ditylenchus destructor]
MGNSNSELGKGEWRKTHFKKVTRAVAKAAAWSIVVPVYAIGQMAIRMSETPPGLQFLHCVEFKGDSPGGESTLVDGYAVAEHLRHHDPEAFRLLRDVPLRHYFSGANESYSCVGTTLKLDKKGLVQCIRFNQANRAPIETDPELIRPFYKALNTFANLVRSKEFMLDFRLKEGEMLVFNNHRMLHGRLKYDARTTSRHLKVWNFTILE